MKIKIGQVYRERLGSGRYYDWSILPSTDEDSDFVLEHNAYEHPNSIDVTIPQLEKWIKDTTLVLQHDPNILPDELFTL